MVEDPIPPADRQDEIRLRLSSVEGSVEHDASVDLVTDIETRLETEFPDLQERPEVLRTIQTVVRERSSMFMGPHPPPQMLAEYESICPGWAVRLLEQGEREQRARIESNGEQLAQTRLMIESDVQDLKAGRHLESRGQVFGFIAFTIIASIGVTGMFLGQVAVAITCFTTFALGVLGFFIQKRKSVNEQNKGD